MTSQENITEKTKKQIISKGLEDVIKEQVRQYLDTNCRLFKTDEAYTISCHLKPRLVSGAVENACSECRKRKLLRRASEKKLDYIFNLGMRYALDYIGEKK